MEPGKCRGIAPADTVTTGFSPLRYSNGYRSFNQIRQYLLLKRNKILTHITIAYRSKGKAEHDAFAAFDQEADTLLKIFGFSHTAKLRKSANQQFLQFVREVF